MLIQKQNIQKTVVFLIGIAALAVGIFVYQHMNSNKPINSLEIHGTRLEEPRIINAFELRGIDGQPFSNINLKGQWTMMFFGFTNCGSLCPTTLAELAKMYRLLEKNKAKVLPRVVMISIDPQRDSLQRLKSYVKAFNSSFEGARGEESSIKAITRELGIAYARIALKEDSKTNSYDMEHTGTIILFNPKGELSAFFTTPHEASLLAKDFQQLTS